MTTDSRITSSLGLVLSYFLKYYKPCSCKNYISIESNFRIVFTVTSYVIWNEISGLKVNQVLLQLSVAKFGVWRKLARRHEKIYWPGYLEQISLFVLGHQLIHNLGQFKVARNFCWALKSRCASITPFTETKMTIDTKYWELIIC